MEIPFESRTPINGSMLKQFANQLISIMVRVESVDGLTLLATSTDNQQLTISLSKELRADEGVWVEVIGLPSAGNKVRGQEVIKFRGETKDFDSESYNTMIQLLSNVKEFYRYG